MILGSDNNATSYNGSIGGNGPIRSLKNTKQESSEERAIETIQLGATYIAANVDSIAPAFVSAVIRQHGMDIGIDWWYALPVLLFSAR